MKWIKASERLPDKRHNYHVKVDYEIDSLSGTWNTASLWNGEFWEHPTQYDSWTGKPSKLNVAQWLDESLSTETGQPTYTIAQIRQAGKEGEVNHLDVEHIIDLLKDSKVETPEQDELWNEHLDQFGSVCMYAPITEPERRNHIVGKLKSKYILIKKR